MVSRGSRSSLKYRNVLQPSTSNASLLLGHPWSPSSEMPPILWATPAICSQRFLPPPRWWLICWHLAPQSGERVCLLLALAPDCRGTSLCVHCSLFWKVPSDLFCHHCQLFQVSSFVLAHQSRHHEDQMQMCPMKSSSKRSRVKTCSVSISLSFSWAPLTATLVTTQHSCSNLCGLITVQIVVLLPVFGT